MCNSLTQKYTSTSLIEPLKNGPQNYVFTDEGDVSNYFGAEIKNNSDGTFEISQSHLVVLKINHVGLEVSASLKARETSSGKPLMHKYKYSIGRKYIWNYRSAFSMLSYLQG